jgi:DNA-binding IclR family transcriptional regulator
LTLVERGYRVQNSVTARYAIGSKRRLLARFAPDNDLVQLAEGPMRELRDCLGHSVVVSAMTLRGVLVLNTVAGAAATEIGVRPGSELPFHASAQGKILLVQCAASAAGARAGASTAGFHSPHAGRPRHDQGGTVACGEARLCLRAGRGNARLNAVAAPIFDDKDACVGALALVGSIQFLPAEPSSASISALRVAAEQISRKIGHGHVETAAAHPARRKSV